MIRQLFHSMRWNRSFENALRRPITKRSFAATNSIWAKKMPDRPPLVSDDEFTESYLKGSGPGGQKINKTSSAVQLKHIPTGLVLKVQSTRSRSQNRKLARRMLADKLEEMEKGKESRVAVVGESKRKKKSSAVKKSKRKYRLLENEKSLAAEEESQSQGGKLPGEDEKGGP